MQSIIAIFENGIFRPTESVQLPENCRVQLQCRQIETNSEGETDSSAKRTKSIEDKLAEIAAEVPDEEWERLPNDLTDNLDHHLYGTPKK